MNGRAGEVQYRRRKCVLDIPIEMSGVAEQDFLVAPLHLGRWTNRDEAIPREEQLAILAELREWFRGNGFRTDIEYPPEPVDIGNICLHTECSESSLEGIALCRRHFDESLLV